MTYIAISQVKGTVCLINIIVNNRRSCFKQKVIQVINLFSNEMMNM